MLITTNFTKIPNYFSEQGLTKNPLLSAFLLWAFSRCRSISKKIIFNQKEVEIAPYEFIFGLESCSEETGITIQQLRTILKDLINRQVLEKSTGKSTNKFTIYKWVTERFQRKEESQTTGKISDNQQQRRYILHNKSKDLLFPQPAVAVTPVFQLPSIGKIISISEACSYAYIFGSSLYKKIHADPPPIFPNKELNSLKENSLKTFAENKTEVTKSKRSMKSLFDRTQGDFCDIDKKMIDQWKEKFPYLNLNYEFEKMRKWLLSSKGKKRKCTARWIEFVWLAGSEKSRYQSQQNRIAFFAEKDKIQMSESLKKIAETDWENDPELQLPEQLLRQYAQ